MVQREYCWKDSYIVHDWRKKDADYLYFDRWVQILEVLAVDRRERDYDKWRLAAFDGWQNSLYQPYVKPKKFESYLKDLGIRDPNKLGKSKASELEEANKVLEELGINSVVRSIQSRRENKS